MKPRPFSIAAIILIFVMAGAAALWLYNNDMGARNVLISDATASAKMGESGAVQIFLNISNDGLPQKIVSVSSPEAAGATFAGEANIQNIVLPGRSKISFAQDGTHILLRDFSTTLEEGRLIPLTLVLEPAGEIVTRVRFTSEVVMDHSQHGGMEHMSQHKVGDDEPAPDVALSVDRNSQTGMWTANAAVKNFRFAEELADGDHVDGTGHGHIYLNGVKLGRLYGATTDIGLLPKGKHEVRVTLNTNNHKTYIVDGAPLTVTAIINEP